MTFQSFLDEVKTLTERKLPRDITIHYRSVQKNNGVVYTGLYLDNCERIIASPLIYMEPFFDAFKNETPLDSIVEKIREILMSPMPENILKNAEEDHHFLLDDVVIRLVNASDNEAYLGNAAYTRYLDMAATFGVMIKADETTEGTIMVTPEIMNDFRMDEERLFEYALKNTERLLGEEVFDLEYYLETLMERRTEMEEKGEPAASGGIPWVSFDEIPVAPNRVYILTNRSNRFGAVAMLYSKKMRVLSEALKLDLYILPCSVHEVLLIPKRKDCKEDLKRMVLAVNESDVEPEEVLTNSVYEYSRETGMISIVA